MNIYGMTTQEAILALDTPKPKKTRSDQQARDRMVIHMKSMRRSLVKYSFSQTTYERGMISGLAIAYGCSTETLKQLSRMREIRFNRRADRASRGD